MLFITWSGLGWVVPIIIIIGGLWGFLEGPRRDLYFIAGNLFASAFIWIIGNFLNYGDTPPFVVNKASRQARGRAEHTLYYIRMELWAFLPLALVVTVLGLVIFLRLRTS
jgi:hypothetical protein